MLTHIYKLVINVTAGCGRGGAASVVLQVTKQKTVQTKRQQTEKNTVDGMQGIIKEMYVEREQS